MTMRKFILLFVHIVAFNVLSSHAQMAQKYENSAIMNSSDYQDGNNYQKDFLLMTELLREVHPAFSSGLPAPFNMDSLRTVGYREMRTCTSITAFRSYLQAILSRLNDGHTALLPVVNESLIYPFMLYMDTDKVYLRGVNKEYEGALGNEILEINNQPAFKVIDSFKASISSDNEIYFYDKVGGFMQLYSVWENNAYCLPDSMLKFRFSDGTSISLRPTFKQEINMAFMPNNLTTNSVRKNSKSPFLYKILPEKSICYLQFNTCVDQCSLRSQYDMTKSSAGLSPESLEKRLSQIPRFDEFLELMFQEMRNAKIQTLVVDVRNNSGGNSRLCDVLLSWIKPYQQIKRYSSAIRFSKLWEATYPLLADKYKQAFLDNHQSFEWGKLYQSSSLPSLNKGTQRDEKTKGYFRLNKDTALVFNGNLIVIQNAKTYSSAGLLVSTIVDNNLGIVIGGKSSYKPCHYGDLLYWMLPNTNVKGCISHKIFIRPDAAKCGETTLLPTVQLESTWKDVVSGADVCWEWVLSH